MAKKDEIPENQEPETPENKIEEKTDETIKKAVKKGVNKSEAVNIIGDITPPEDPTDKNDVKKYFKEISEKLDQLLKNKTPEIDEENEEEETPSQAPAPKMAWYDRPIL